MNPRYRTGQHPDTIGSRVIESRYPLQEEPGPFACIVCDGLRWVADAEGHVQPCHDCNPQGAVQCANNLDRKNR